MDCKNNSWLLNLINLGLVRECRGLIAAEFGVSISFTDPALIDRIQGYISASKNLSLSEKAQLIEELKGQVFKGTAQPHDLTNMSIVRRGATRSISR
jgi:hypothetical protein